MTGSSPSACRVCGTALHAFMSFGRMPIANGFLSPDRLTGEYFFELAPALCETCGMFQLMEQPAPERMFHDAYAFYSSTSRAMEAHFADFAAMVAARLAPASRDPFVVELGSNDGIMLRHFKDRGIRHLGIEPSANVAAVARQAGVETLCAFFDAALGATLAAERGQADAVLAANVMCHIPTLGSVAEGVRRLLRPDGLLIFEDPYLGAMVGKTAYDQIYDEHVFIFSALSVAQAFGRHGMELVDVLPQPTHGGSMRYVLAPQGSRRPAPSVAELIAAERAQGLDRPQAFLRFKARCEESRDQLMDVLERLRAEGRRVVGYGATSKSTTVTNYCGITPAYVEFISDTTPIKHGKLSPGAHIPVRPYDDFLRRYPDYALLFAWNHGAEIRAKETGFVAAGGKWITYVPRVEVEP